MPPGKTQQMDSDQETWRVLYSGPFVLLTCDGITIKIMQPNVYCDHFSLDGYLIDYCLCYLSGLLAWMIKCCNAYKMLNIFIADIDKYISEDINIIYYRIIKKPTHFYKIYKNECPTIICCYPIRRQTYILSVA